MSAARRRDARATTAAIERAAVDLALERGYGAVTVDMICERAGVSQRTFFNHFPTKDDAVLGVDGPRVDESAAREFLVGRGPLLSDAMRLVALPGAEVGQDRELLLRRLRVIGSDPGLFTRQMERMHAVADEVAGVVFLRLRARYADESEEDLRAQATVITHLLAGLLRQRGEAWAGAGGPPPDPAAWDATLASVVSKLG